MTARLLEVETSTPEGHMGLPFNIDPLHDTPTNVIVPEVYLKAQDLWVVDVECTMRGPDKDPSPWWPENKLVMVGWYHVQAGDMLHEGNYSVGTKDKFLQELKVALDDRPCPQIIAGHNLKFDLNWLEIEQSIRRLNVERLVYWDTMVFDYLYTGQRNKMTSLDDLATQHLGVGKDSTVKDLWDAGVDTDAIPTDMLKRYLGRDLALTAAVMAKQLWQYIFSKDNFKMVVAYQMELVSVLADLETAGWNVDKEYVENKADEARVNVARLEGALTIMAAEGSSYVEGNSLQRGWSYLTPRGISNVLFGYPGMIYEQRLLNGTYKNGNPKYKWEYVNVPRIGLAGFTPSGEASPILGYSVHDNMLTEVMDFHKNDPTNAAVLFCKGVKALRKMKKLSGTYWEPTLERIQAGESMVVHPSYNQCIAATGRLTSSNPNGQNAPPVVKAMVVPRNSGSVLIDVDFAQLEMCALAIVSQDQVLMCDLLLGVDVHQRTGARVFGMKMTKEQRRIVKGVNFGLIYGGSAKTLAEQTGTEIELVKKLIKGFYDRYPTVKTWQESMYVDICAVLRPDSRLEPKGGELPKSTVYQSPAGRKYYFHEQESPEFMLRQGAFSLSPTMTKNYPVQGLATGDIVPIFLCKLKHGLLEGANGWAIMFSTIHDSVTLEVRNGIGMVDQVKQCVKKALVSTCWSVAQLTAVDVDDLKKILKLEGVVEDRWGVGGKEFEVVATT